ncbi:Copper binding protein 1 [Heracleum sosnowskyi]|uniref:Copper binding protein 1 n=1 Tax=Heracleum sosnowskyi TaxID=360622 RepID=A0AAD8JG42_9APIA|nr:Copper binding protein 1 [Heracleum sosnowskyi]
MGFEMVQAHVHHIVKGEAGWEQFFELGFKSSELMMFKVGDHIWFRNAQEGIVELQSRKEYLSCDVSNPIKMYTDGPDKISLDQQGVRYFASGNPRECKNGLKLHVEVHPQLNNNGTQTDANASGVVKAAGPTSTSTRLGGFSYMLFIGLLVLVAGLV